MRTNIITFLLLLCLPLAAQKQKVWIDSDTGNETDDVYAIVRLLADQSVNVVGVSSAHFNNADLIAFDKWNQYATAGIKTVDISQKLNEGILATMHKINIPHPIGADRQMGRAWGGSEPRKSVASDLMISIIKKLPHGEKLDIICTGAMTNLASALALDPSILPSIRCYVLGARYNAAKGAWDKNEFNTRCDLNAFDFLLNNKQLDLILMPTSTASPYRFVRDSLYARLSDKIAVEKMLKDRWKETNPDDKIRTLWDLALVEAYLNPQSATIEEVNAPPENTPGKVKIYSRIDRNALVFDFWKSLKTLNPH